jgi:hypothetical protein
VPSIVSDVSAALEELLRNRFPQDIIEPVGKGEFGGDVIQHVNGAMGATSGIILWEFKRTKNWSDSWLSKLRELSGKLGDDGVR